MFSIIFIELAAFGGTFLFFDRINRIDRIFSILFINMVKNESFSSHFDLFEETLYRVIFNKAFKLLKNCNLF